MSKINSLHRRSAIFGFLRSGRGGGVLLIFSGLLAMMLANSPFGSGYYTFLRMQIGSNDIVFWVNDGLMTIFFLLVGLELRREMTTGELSTPGSLVAPAIAAVGGMIVPAMVFSLFNYDNKIAMRGWAVPVATDIAFALAVLGVLGRRIPIGLTIFLTALAIIDDLGAIIVIALFYSSFLNLYVLAEAAGLLCAMIIASRLGLQGLAVYLLGGCLLWTLVARSGIHPTLSGVALAFVIPSGTKRPGQVSGSVKLERSLEPVVAYFVLPVFGLCNAGLNLDTIDRGVAFEPLFLGTFAALLFGKQIGVFGAVYTAVRLRLAVVPAGVSHLQLYGAGIICGIGFTMSLFIGDLAFSEMRQVGEIKLAVFLASLAAAALGLLVLSFATRKSS